MAFTLVSLSSLCFLSLVSHSCKQNSEEDKFGLQDITVLSDIRMKDGRVWWHLVRVVLSFGDGLTTVKPPNSRTGIETVLAAQYPRWGVNGGAERDANDTL